MKGFSRRKRFELGIHIFFIFKMTGKSGSDLLFPQKLQSLFRDIIGAIDVADL